MTLPRLDPLDRRLNAFRPDLAETRLRGMVEATRFVEGRPARVVAAVADLRPQPDAGRSLDHQLLLGEEVLVFDEREGWSWVRALADGYVGWLASTALGPVGDAPTHVAAAARTFAWPGPDMKLPTTRALSMGSAVTVVGEARTRGSDYLLLDTGEAVFARHFRPAGGPDADYVEVAGRLVGTPYLWGGSSGFGADCSGLVRIAMHMAGRKVLRDSDMQAATLGEPFDPGGDYSGLRRGDLVFWRGHVAIAQGDGNLLHANGHSMDVRSEPAAAAIARIAGMFEKPIGCRRP